MITVKKHIIVLSLILTITLAVGLNFYFKKENIRFDSFINYRSTNSYSNWHEKQNFASIEEANAYAQSRLEKSYNIYLNNVIVDIGYDWDGKLFVPIRSISESLNWEVNWIPEKQMIQLVKGDEEAYVDIVNFFGKAYIDIDTLEYIIKLDKVEIAENCIYLSKQNSKLWEYVSDKSQALNFYINDMLMTKYAYKHENDIYVPTKVFATSLGKIFRYNAEEGFVSIDGRKVDSIPIDGIVYSKLSELGNTVDLSKYNIRYDNIKQISGKIDAIYKGPNKKQIALTFDDYIDDEVLPLLDVLDDYNIKASFFIIGNTIDANKDILLEIHKRGHLIANHTWDHLNNHSITEDEFRAQLIATQLAIQKCIGITPMYYRPPGGYYNTKMLEIAKEIGLTTVMWSLNSNDASFDSKPAHITKTVLDNLTHGSIIVMHTKRKSTIEALPEIIKKAKKQGYEFVTIDEFIN